MCSYPTHCLKGYLILQAKRVKHGRNSQIKGNYKYIEGKYDSWIYLKHRTFWMNLKKGTYFIFPAKFWNL